MDVRPGFQAEEHGFCPCLDKDSVCWLNLPFPKVSLLVKERHDFLEVIQPRGGLDTKEPVHQTV